VLVVACLGASSNLLYIRVVRVDEWFEIVLLPNFFLIAFEMNEAVATLVDAALWCHTIWHLAAACPAIHEQHLVELQKHRMSSRMFLTRN
jgi:hypothetical protein